MSGPVWPTSAEMQQALEDLGPPEPCAVCGLDTCVRSHVDQRIRRSGEELADAQRAYTAAIAPLLRSEARARRRRWLVHNLVAHPLLVLCPPVGVWLHDRTAPEADR